MGDRAGQVEAARGLRSVPDRVQSHTSIPGWKGDLLIAGLLAQGVVRLTLDGEKVTGEERIGLGDLIRNAVQGPNGAVYALTDCRGNHNRNGCGRDHSRHCYQYCNEYPG